MDLLFKRYASPFLLLEQMQEAHRLDEFVSSIVEIDNEEKTWEFYLHTIYMHGKTYNEFTKPVKKQSEEKPVTQAELEATINESRKILNSFNPSEDGGGHNGS